MTLDAFAGDDAQIRPPAGKTGVPGPLSRMIRHQRVAVSHDPPKLGLLEHRQAPS